MDGSTVRVIKGNPGQGVTQEPVEQEWDATAGQIVETRLENSHIQVNVGKQKVPTLVDTGATVSLATVSLFNVWLQGCPSYPGLLPSDHKKLIIPNGEAMTILGRWRVPIRIGNHIFMTWVQVVEGLEEGNLEQTPLVIGRDFLQFYGVHLDFEAEKFIITPHVSLAAVHTQILPAGHDAIVSVQATIPVHNGIVGLVDGVTHEDALSPDVGEGVITICKGQTGVHLSNPHPHDVVIHEGKHLATCQPIVGTSNDDEHPRLWQMFIPNAYKCGDGHTCWTQTENQTPGNLDQTKPKHTTEEPVKLDLSESQLNDAQKAQVVSLINEYRDVFVGSDGVIGRTDYIQHHIRTDPATQPIASKPYRVNYKNREVIEEQVNEMLEKNIIQPSASPWSAPVVLVPKPDGSLRFCVDYRKLNNVTVVENFPLPDIRQSLEIFGQKGAKIFSCLDLKCAYWQVELCPESAEKTAFITPDGLWQFRVLPFGLSGAPMTFSRLMAEVLSGLLWKKCLVYLDDIILFSKDFPEHLEILREVFERLRKAGLKLAPNKCYIGRTKVKYLGHYISADGIEVDPKKVQAVKTYPVPKNVTEVRAFLGLAGYYRRFCKDFANIARPLHHLTKQDVPFHWGTEQQVAFDTLKDLLTKAPILAYPHPDKRYILYTDASHKAVGYVLSQNQDGLERVISYGGKSLSPAEQNYPITELEFLAVVYAVKDNDCYLRGSPFTVVTDHASLKGYINQSQPKGRMARWIMSLQEHDFDIKHRAGRVHNNADACSRRDYPEIGVGLDPNRPLFYGKHEVSDVANEDTNWEGSVTLVTQEERAKFGTMQKQDPLIRNLYAYHAGVLDDSKVEASVFRSRDEYVMLDGVLYHFWIKAGKGPPSERTITQVVVPREYRTKILEQYHDSPLGGHRQFASTYSSIREKYYWPEMAKDTKNWVASCTNCTKADKSKQRRNAPLQKVKVAGPFLQLHCDILGPFPEGEGGYKYVLTMVDQFTRWVELIPLKTQTAMAVANAVYEEWITRYGTPAVLVSDRGTNFLSSLLSYLCKMLGVDRITTSSFNPKSNGVNECRNKIIVDTLRRLVQDNPHSWPQYVATTASVLRTTRCGTLGMSPYELVFGRQPVMAIDLEVPVYANVAKTVMEQIRVLKRKAEYLEEVARQTDAEMKEKYKEQFDRKANNEDYMIGDKCWVYTPSSAQKLKAGKKLVSCWVGPYRVIKKKGRVNVDLKRCSDDLPIQSHIHVNRLKPFVARTVRPNPPPLEIAGFLERGKPLSTEELEPLDITDENKDDDPVPVVENDEEPAKEIISHEVNEDKPYYEVEEILGKRLRRNREPQFLIKWANFPHSENSWEPFSNLGPDLQKAILSGELATPKKATPKDVPLGPISDWSDCDNHESTKKYLEKFGISEGEIRTDMENVAPEVVAEGHESRDNSDEVHHVQNTLEKSELKSQGAGTEGLEPIAHRTRSRLKLP